MNGILRVFLSLSASGSLLILLLLLVRPLLQNRLSRRWQYYVWLIVIARLLLPLSPEVSLMGAVFQRGEALPAAVSAPEADLILPPAVPEAPSGNAALPPEDGSTPIRETGGALRQDLWAVWLAAAALLLLRKVTVYQSFGRYMRAGCTEVTDIARLDCLGEICGELGIKRPIELYENRMASSPMLLGIFRPCVILPDAGLPDADLRYTLRHELVHYRRRDLLYKWLVQVTVCLHWFNPLVWWMGREISRACELACDEAVLRSLEPQERRAYGDMLLRAMAAGGGYGNSAGSVTLHESGALLKERLGAIMNFRKTSKAAAVCSLLLAAVLLMGGAAAGAYTGPVKTGAAVPGAVKGDPSVAYRYTQEGYYEAPYLFEIGWNVRENAKKMYESTRVALPGGGTMTVLFTGSCKASLQDKEIRAALSAVLGRLRAETAGTDFPLTCPLVTGVRNAGGGSAAELAERCYQEEDIAGFAAAFAVLDEAGQRKYLNLCYEDGGIAFFGACMNGLPQDSPLLTEFAERAYADGDIARFSIPVYRMSKAGQEAWAARAIEDGRLAFSAMLADASGTEWAEQGTGKLKAELEARQLEEYQAYGITKQGMDYYYQGRLTRIFVDFQANESFVTLNMNPKGTAAVKVTRNADGSIKSVGYLTESEIKELFGDDFEEDGWDDSEAACIPVDVKTVAAGESVFLGEYTLSEGDKIWYDITAETGNRMQVFFAKDGQKDAAYWSVNNRRQPGETLRCAADFTVGPPAKSGTYRLFLRAPDGALTGVSGGFAVTAGNSSENAVVNISKEDLPDAARKAMQNCAVRTWYLIHAGERQYVYYNGFAWSFGYEPRLSDGKWTVDIVRFRKKDSGYLLLSLPEGTPVSVTCDGEAVTLTEIK